MTATSKAERNIPSLVDLRLACESYSNFHNLSTFDRIRNEQDEKQDEKTSSVVGMYLDRRVKFTIPPAVALYAAISAVFCVHGFSAHATSQIPFTASLERPTAASNAAEMQQLTDWDYDLRTLQPVPLTVNGNSTNRVDLVYFGDGCEYLTFKTATATC